MEHSQFDDALRDVLQSNELPYEPQQWDLLAARLDAVQKPVQKSSIIPLMHWAPAAAAACFIAMIAWYAADYQHAAKTNNQDTEVAVIKAKPLEQKTEKSIAARINDKKAADKTYGLIKSIQRPVASKDTKVVLAASPAITKPSIKPDNTETVTVIDKETEEPSRQMAAHEKARAIFLLPDKEPALSKSRRTAFDINGGYNIGNAKNNFTLGVTVKQKLSRKLRLETGIAVVSSSHTAYTRVVSQGTLSIGALSTGAPGTGAPNTGTPSIGAPGTGTPSIGTPSVRSPSVEPFGETAIEYQASTANLLYLQAAPSLSYQVYRGLSAGGGVDAQRLLSNVDKATSISNLGEATTPQPEWDFGLTGRLDYQVAKRLRAGLMYRESIHALSKSAAGAARRNYLLLQLSYTIF